KEMQEEIPKLAEAQPPASASPDQQQRIDTAIKLSFIDTFKQSALIATILSGLAVFIAYFFISPQKR
ncbi:MAG: MFS transporter, partial [Fulvivirga sp.]|nr:MFS transporter [Fulvivirga sp.]